MSLVFLDTSALIKLYVPEIGSSWLESLVSGNQVVISELGLYECATLLRRRYLEGSLSLTQAEALYTQIQQDSQAFDIILLRADNQLDRVVNMAFGSGTIRIRALDAIHLAAAQVANEVTNGAVPPQPFVLVSADRNFLQFALFQGFTIQNPEDHP